jgi:hypothetical protein
MECSQELSFFRKSIGHSAPHKRLKGKCHPFVPLPLVSRGYPIYNDSLDCCQFSSQLGLQVKSSLTGPGESPTRTLLVE